MHIYSCNQWSVSMVAYDSNNVLVKQCLEPNWIATHWDYNCTIYLLQLYRIVIAITETWNLFTLDLIQLCSYLIVPHFSLKNNDLTGNGVLALARALQRNNSLHKLKWVIKRSMVSKERNVNTVVASHLILLWCVVLRLIIVTFNYMKVEYRE